jgi:hypothetical protein
MSAPHQDAVDGARLVEYLLGSLPQSDSEALDESSVADDEFAMRLSAVENDLLDAYVRGQLSPPMREKFRTFYLSSGKRRQKLSLAEGLFALEEKAAASRAPGDRLSASYRAWESQLTSSWRHLLFFPRWRWGFAAVAAMLVAGILLTVDNFRLYRQVSRAQAFGAELQQRERELQAKLDQEHAANRETKDELDRVRESLAELGKRSLASPPGEPPSSSPVGIAFLVLSPQMRGAGRIATLSLSPATRLVNLSLELESNDFPRYRVALKDSATNQIVWRSGTLAAPAAGARSALSIRVPARLLQSRSYVTELVGCPTNGAPEFINSYMFMVNRDRSR